MVQSRGIKAINIIDLRREVDPRAFVDASSDSTDASSDLALAKIDVSLGATASSDAESNSSSSD